MQFKLRSVNTKFWEDPFIEELRPEEKLIFLYLLTNPMTNMLGIYEVSIKRISYDTGLTSERVEKSLKIFESKGKVIFKDNYVVLPNFLKNQNLNSNMKKGVLNIYNDLPKWLRDSIYEKPLKAFESLRNALLNMNIEYEIESESEEEGDVKDSEYKIFYREEWNNAGQHLMASKYKHIVKYIMNLDKNIINEPGEHILKLKKQLSFADYIELQIYCDKRRTTIKDMIDSWLNKPSYSTGKVSVYAVLKKWASKEPMSGTNFQETKTELIQGNLIGKKPQ